jgi:cytochrome b561
MPAWQRRAAAVSHGLLYLLLFVIPLSGWIYSSATGVHVVYLGLVLTALAVQMLLNGVRSFIATLAEAA